jgi:NADH-quinone oxidoreductase subunit N
VNTQAFITLCLLTSIIPLLSVYLSGGLWDVPAFFIHQGYIICDFYTVTVKWYLLGSIFVFLIVTFEYLLKFSEQNKINLVEFPVVICFSSFFMLFLVSSFNLFGAYLSLEAVTFSLYILAGINCNSQTAVESSMKYFCLGALSSGFLLFGVALTFIATKTLDFAELKFLFDSLSELPLFLSFALLFMFFGF